MATGANSVGYFFFRQSISFSFSFGIHHEISRIYPNGDTETPNQPTDPSFLLSLSTHESIDRLTDQLVSIINHIISIDQSNLRVLDNGGLQALGVLDVDGLDVRVQLLLGALLVVALAGDADADAEGDALDAGLPHLLVQLGVEADVLGALVKREHEVSVVSWCIPD